MKFYRIVETAAGGAIGTGSIAAVHTPLFQGDQNRREMRSGENDWRSNAPKEKNDRAQLATTRAQLQKAKELKKKKSKFSDFANRLFTKRTVSEGAQQADISGVVSRLKGLEKKNDYTNTNTVTYGVEDDEGNLMKITVPTDQSKSFEHRLSGELGEIENNKIYGYENTGVSLAEILYNMRNEFKIVDVEFPEIPEDAIYNMDKVTVGNNLPEDVNQGQTQNGQFDDQMNAGQDMNNDQGMNAGQDMNNDQGMNNDQDMNGDMGDLDQDNSEEFTEEPEDSGNDFKSLFQELVKLMTAQTEKDRAVADAEAEKARALQAEYTAKAASSEVGRQEELMRMEAGMQMQKKKEKDAKRIADLAKYRVNQSAAPSASNFEGYTSILGAILTEENDLDDDLDSEQMVRSQMRMARDKYKILPTDGPDTQTYKRATMQTVTNQLNAKLKQIRDKAVYANQQKQAAQAAAQAATQAGGQSGESSDSI